MADNPVTNAIGNYLKGLEGWAGDQANITFHNMGDIAQKAGHNFADWVSPEKLQSPLPMDNQPPVHQPSLVEQEYFGKKPIDTTTDNHIYSSYTEKPEAYTKGFVGDPPISPTDIANVPIPTTRPTQPNTLASLSNAPVAPVQGNNTSGFSWGSWQPKYAQLWEKTAPSQGITPDMVRVLVTSENGREDPGFTNTNGNGTVDVGLTQLNVPSTDRQTIERLKNPDVNIQEGVKRLASRVNLLGDPVLAMASWNLGPGGAVLNPQAALERAQTIYRNAGLPLPQTPFTQNPQGFVAQNMDKYRQLGLFK